MDVKRQTSAGGVIVRHDGELELCLINPQGRGAWALPKGWVEPGETDEEAALREIREETGLSGEIRQKLGTIDYWFYSREDKMRVHKTVHFFLVGCTGGSTDDHDHEVSEARWLPVERALDLMTYPNEREMVRKAVQALAGDPSA